MDESQSHEPLAAGPALIRMGTLLNGIYETHARELGLTPQQARLLFVVAESPANMLGLGATVRLTKSTMTSLVDRMEELGLLVRTADPDDRRRLLVSATDHGHDLSRSFEAAMRDSIRALLGAVPDVDQGELARMLSALLARSEALLPAE